MYAGDISIGAVVLVGNLVVWHCDLEANLLVLTQLLDRTVLLTAFFVRFAQTIGARVILRSQC